MGRVYARKRVGREHFNVGPNQRVRRGGGERSFRRRDGGLVCETAQVERTVEKEYD